MILLSLACGLGCHSHDNPQASFEHARQRLRDGDLIGAQDEAERGYKRFQTSSSQWAEKFKVLKCEALLLRGMYPQALALLDSQEDPPDGNDQLIEIVALKAVANARLHQFHQAEQNVAQGNQLCSSFPASTCGEILRARGILAMQQGQTSVARQFFEQTLSFARLHQDSFLEATALLNLGSWALLEQHFDEAIDWTNEAYQTAITLNAGTLITKALGNLGWAYYNLGDAEKSLQLSLEAEKRAISVADVIDQLSWITNAGYVYADLGDLGRAKQSYSKALDLATAIQGSGDIYNALRALALVSVERGELEEARNYSDRAIAMARMDGNRQNELYPLFVKGLIAAQLHDGTLAEQIFEEVDRDSSANASLKWQAEHALGRLFEEQQRTNAADSEYRAALTTFEAARSSLNHNDSKLPFFNNAIAIYDDYVHFLVSCQKPREALAWADYSRARTLTEGFVSEVPTASLRITRLNPQQIAHQAKGVVLFYSLGTKQSYLWAITPQKISLFALPPRSQIESSVQRYRESLGGPDGSLESSDKDGISLYLTLIDPARGLLEKGATIFVIPDGALNNLNFETLIAPGPKPHYWIEDANVVNANSLRLLALSFSRNDPYKAKHKRSLLLFGNSVSPSEEYPELPRAAEQMSSISRHFPGAKQTIFTRTQATPEAYLTSSPEQFSNIHFVAHGTASRLSPLDSAIILSSSPTDSDSFKLYAREIVRHPLHADLVTISACYGAGGRTYSGEGLVGLAWAFLRAGAHNVIAALWEVTDASTDQLMDSFYEELNKGASPDIALHSAKLLLLRGTAFRNPFYWATFQLYAGA